MTDVLDEQRGRRFPPSPRSGARSRLALERVVTARIGAIAGLASAVVMTAGWIVAGLVQPAYSWSRQEISDLGAMTARHAWIWNLADSLSGLLTAVFAAALLGWVGSRRAGRIGAMLVGAVGLGSVLDGLVREDCPLSTSRACQRLRDGPGLSWHHQVHDIESIAVFAAMVAAPFFLARAFERAGAPWGLSLYSRLTGAALVVVVLAYLPLYGDPGGGIAERLLAVLFMAWVAVVALALLGETRAGRPRPRSPA